MHYKMKPGDSRTFKRRQGEVVVLAIGLWAERQGRQTCIHITGTSNFHATLVDDPKSEKCHRALFRNLREALMDSGCWPLGDESIEAPESRPV